MGNVIVTVRHGKSSASVEKWIDLFITIKPLS